MYKIKINSHGVILTQYGSQEVEPVHGSVDSEGFTWVEAQLPIDGTLYYWTDSAWEACPTRPNIWSIWENAQWVESTQLKDQIQGMEHRKLRTHRNHILGGCDWTQIADAPLSGDKKAEWVTYRQALRDFPASNNPPTTDYTTLTWPTPPSE